MHRRKMKKWQLADSFFRLRMYRAKPVTSESRRLSEVALKLCYNIPISLENGEVTDGKDTYERGQEKNQAYREKGW